MNENAPQFDTSELDNAGLVPKEGEASVMGNLRLAQESGDETAIAKAQQAADEKYIISDSMGPPKELFNQHVIETSESRRNAELYINHDLEEIAKALNGNEKKDQDWFARKVNDIGSELEKLWQGRVRGELSGSSEFGEDYKKALATPEAQSIYDEEVGKFDRVLNNPSLASLANAVRGVRVAGYRRLNEDILGSQLAEEQRKAINRARGI